jgi:hypothetical protein
MATVTGTKASLRAAAFKFAVIALGWAVPMLLSASAAAVLTYFYTEKANKELVLQQQKLTDLQQFRSSGAQLQQALGRMSDAVVDGENLNAPRREMRDAINRNISDANAVQEQLGPDATKAYIKRLAALRETVDETETDDGAAMWQGSLNVMEDQKRLLEAAQKRIREQ